PSPACSEIWRVCHGDRSVRAEKGRVLSANCFRPVVAHEATIGNPSRPGRGEDAFILHSELDLQALLSHVWVDGTAPIRGETWPIYGPAFSLRFGGGFAVDQAVALDDMQRLAMGRAKEINSRGRRGLDADCIDHQGVTLIPADRVALPTRR